MISNGDCHNWASGFAYHDTVSTLSDLHPHYAPGFGSAPTTRRRKVPICICTFVNVKMDTFELNQVSGRGRI